MNTEQMNRLATRYRDLCRRLDSFEESATQGSVDVKSAFEQCRPTLLNHRDAVERLLHQLKSSENEDETAYLSRSATESLCEFERSIMTAEEKIQSVSLDSAIFILIATVIDDKAAVSIGQGSFAMYLVTKSFSIFLGIATSKPLFSR